MSRIVKLQKKLRAKKIPLAIFITTESMSNSTVHYFTNTSVVTGVLIVPVSSKPTLYVSPLEKINGSSSFSVRSIDLLENDLSRLKSKKVAVDNRHLRISDLKFLKKHIRAKFIDLYSDVVDICRNKSPIEVKAIEKAVKTSEDIFDLAFKNWNSFYSELDVVRFLKMETFKRNCALAFPPVVASGKNASVPHHEPTSKKLQKGFCIIDFGVKYNGFCADLTRTIFLGTPSNKEVAIFNRILSKKKALEKLLKPGVFVKELWAEYHKDGYKMIHALGHGLGREVHEVPNLGRGKDILQIGDVVALEPAVYVKGKFGIRLEDDYLITEKGSKLLSNHHVLMVFK
jgi:Xaa-Pro aminopeptidase